MNGSLNYKTILSFFLPLIFMTELHQISHSLVHAFLARLSDPMITIASFSVAFAFNSTISSITQVSILGGISFIKNRVSFWKTFRFYSVVCIILFVCIESVALTALGDIMFGEWMGASAEVVKQARKASAIMALWIFPILIRNFCYALAMVYRHTIIIPKATIIRLSSIGIFLFLYPFWIEGAAVGAAAMVSCMTVEAVYMVIVIRPLFARLDKEDKNNPSRDEIWRFSWPLMITQFSENAVVLAVNFFLGQLANPDLALAGFGVVNGLIRAFLAPLRNIIQTAQTLVRSRKDIKIIFEFTFYTILILATIVCIIFNTPFRRVILGGALGLTIELSQYATPGVKLIFVVAIFWGYAALMRGLLSAIRRTGTIAITAALRLWVVIMVGSTTFFLPHLNGTIVGTLAIGSAFAIESLFLGWHFRRYLKTSKQLFSHL
jgi:Na+-driven multidrug efflux pump